MLAVGRVGDAEVFDKRIDNEPSGQSNLKCNFGANGNGPRYPQDDKVLATEEDVRQLLLKGLGDIKL